MNIKKDKIFLSCNSPQTVQQEESKPEMPKIFITCMKPSLN